MRDLGEALLEGSRSLVMEWLNLALGTERRFTLCRLDAEATLVTLLRALQLREPDHRLCIVEVAVHGDGLLAGAPQDVQPPSLATESRLYAENAVIRGRAGGYMTSVVAVEHDAVDRVATHLQQATRYGRSTMLLHVPLRDADWFPLLRCLQVLELCVEPDGTRIDAPGLRKPLMQAFVRAASAWDVIPYLGLVDATGASYLMAPGTCAPPGAEVLHPEADRDLSAWLVSSLRDSATGAPVFTAAVPPRRPAEEIRADLESANPERIHAGLRDAVDAMESLVDAPLRSLSAELLTPLRGEQRMVAVDLLAQLIARCEHVTPPLTAIDRRRLLLDVVLVNPRLNLAKDLMRAAMRAEDPAGAARAMIETIAERDLPPRTVANGARMLVRELLRAPPVVRAATMDGLRRHQAKLATLLEALPPEVGIEVRGG